MKRWLIILILALTAGRASAEMALPTTLPDNLVDVDQPQQTPVLSGNSTWVGVMLIVVGALFVAAACVGPIVRFEVPPMQSHDEPPGTSGHHGTMGMEDPEESATKS